MITLIIIIPPRPAPLAYYIGHWSQQSRQLSKRMIEKEFRPCRDPDPFSGQGTSFCGQSPRQKRRVRHHSYYLFLDLKCSNIYYLILILRAAPAQTITLSPPPPPPQAHLRRILPLFSSLSFGSPSLNSPPVPPKVCWASVCFCLFRPSSPCPPRPHPCTISLLLLFLFASISPHPPPPPNPVCSLRCMSQTAKRQVGPVYSSLLPRLRASRRRSPLRSCTV